MRGMHPHGVSEPSKQRGVRSNRARDQTERDGHRADQLETTDIGTRTIVRGGFHPEVPR